MSTKTLPPAGLVRSATLGKNQPAAARNRPAARATKPPASESAARLEALGVAEMPWLSKAGQAALADAPEVSGRPTYRKPAGRR